MNIPANLTWLILVVEANEETRDGIKELLEVVGYQVETARTIAAAVQCAVHRPPDLLLLTIPGTTKELIEAANQLRSFAGLDQHVPIVFFCCQELVEGAKIALEGNIHLSRPDNFNQLRAFLHQLLLKANNMPPHQ